MTGSPTRQPQSLLAPSRIGAIRAARTRLHQTIRINAEQRLTIRHMIRLAITHARRLARQLGTFAKGYVSGATLGDPPSTTASSTRLQHGVARLAQGMEYFVE
jgi:hypothetical protein